MIVVTEETRGLESSPSADSIEVGRREEFARLAAAELSASYQLATRILGNRGDAEDAVNEAINSPLIDVDITGANGVLVNVTGGEDMSIGDAQKVAEMIQAKVSPNARIIWGASVDPALENRIRVMVVITGVKSKNILGPKESKSVKAMNVDFIK